MLGREEALDWPLMDRAMVHHRRRLILPVRPIDQMHALTGRALHRLEMANDNVSSDTQDWTFRPVVGQTNTNDPMWNCRIHGCRDKLISNNRPMRGRAASSHSAAPDQQTPGGWGPESAASL